MYQGTLQNYPALATVLEDYYSDILTFHHEALRVFNRSSTSTTHYLLQPRDHFLITCVRVGECLSLDLEDVQHQIRPNSPEPQASERIVRERKVDSHSVRDSEFAR